MNGRVYITAYRKNQTINQPMVDTSDYLKALYANKEIEVKLPEPLPAINYTYPQTVTHIINPVNIHPDYLGAIQTAYINLSNECRLFADAYPTPIDDQYETFFVPKASGGMREINAPKPALKQMQRSIMNFFMYQAKLLPHNNAFAYIPHRSTVDAMKVHQANGSHWFLKLDIKDFFPSCTHTFVVDQLWQMYPFCYLEHEYIGPILNLCMRKGALPQGAPSSPYLSNILFLPFDYEINKMLHNLDQYYVYTRYADDILISSRNTFDWKEIQNRIKVLLAMSPFYIKDEKTRYGSRAGRNWNLGLMLNKDNNITLGYKFKQRFRASIFNLYQDHQHGVQWELVSVQALMGMISYYHAVAPMEVKEILDKYQQRFGLSVKDIIKEY